VQYCTFDSFVDFGAICVVCLLHRMLPTYLLSSLFLMFFFFFENRLAPFSG